MENITQYHQENNFFNYFKNFCIIFRNVVTAIIKWTFYNCLDNIQMDFYNRLENTKSHVYNYDSLDISFS
jgi:hypothetical protein